MAFPPLENISILMIHFRKYFIFWDITRRIKSGTLGTGVKHFMNKTLHDIENTVSVSSTVNFKLTM